jgi:2-polyprenyl-3-methyl-5-hydroxy-6-metoxy-1,4-benzoquinol methylase
MIKPWKAVMPTVSVADVAEYWDRHPQGSQFLLGRQLEISSLEFFEEVRPYADCFRFPYIMARIEEEARQLRGKHLLEIGCGLGFDAIEFMRRGVRVTATDLTPTNVALAKRHFDLAGVRPEAVEVQDVFKLSYADATFDAAYSIGVLIHTGAPGRALKEIQRVLKPGGRAIMCHFYRRPSLFHALSRLGGVDVVASGKNAPPLTDFFGEAELRDLFAGYRIERLDREHLRLIPSIRRGVKGALYNYGLRPLYNLLPAALRERYANKMSVVAIKPA